MSTFQTKLKDLFTALADTLKERVKDPEASPAVLKEAREFLKDNSITKDNLDIPSFDDLRTAVPLDEFEDDYGTAAH